MRSRRYALVAGGGTGGHLVPALIVARALAALEGSDAVELVGSRRGLDADLLAAEGFPSTLLPGRGIVRRADPGALAANAVALAGLACAFFMALVLVVRRRPAVVVATGGYACVPPSLAAAVTGVPVVLVNVDAVPGAANRVVARVARAVAVAFADTALPRAVVTGVPVRPEIVAAARPTAEARAAARRSLGLPDGRAVVGIVGGSLGARHLNEAALGLAREWRARDDVALFHVVGRRDEAWVREEAHRLERGALVYRWVPYQSDMASFYVAADVVVCRAGANTVAELTVVGVAAVLVPLPGAPGDHQSANARALERAGAAVVVEDAACSPERLAGELDALIQGPGRLEGMRRSASGLGRDDAAAAVTALVRAHARPRGRDPEVSGAR